MTVEFPRPWKAEAMLTGEAAVEVAATADERAAVARRLGVPAVAELACAFRLGPVPGASGRIAAAGRLRARLTRECVVSLEPFEESVNEDFRVCFVPAGTESEDDDPDADDEIPYVGSAVDLGEAAVEQLALSMAPYPRKPGAELAGDAGDGAASPFAMLAGLKPLN